MLFWSIAWTHCVNVPIALILLCLLGGLILFVILSGFLFIEKSMSEELKIQKAPEVSLINRAVMFVSLCIIPVCDVTEAHPKIHSNEYLFEWQKPVCLPVVIYPRWLGLSIPKNIQPFKWQLLSIPKNIHSFRLEEVFRS